MTTNSDESTSGNLEVADGGAVAVESAENHVVGEQAQFDFEDIESEDYEGDGVGGESGAEGARFDGEGELANDDLEIVDGDFIGEIIEEEICLDEIVDEQPEIDEIDDLSAEELVDDESCDSDELAGEDFLELDVFDEPSVDDVYDRRLGGPSKASSLKRTLSRTKGKVTGFFSQARSERSHVSESGEVSELQDEWEQGQDVDEYEGDSSAASDVEVDGEQGLEVETLDNESSSWATTHISEEASVEVVRALQSDEELDAEVAAAIEVTSLLDAVAMLAKFDKELAEVESVLCAD